MSDPHEKLEAFFDGLLPSDEAKAFKEHFATCDECDRRMGELMALDALMERQKARAPVRVPEPEREDWFARYREWLRPAFAGGLAVAATLVLVIGYQRVSGAVPEDILRPDPKYRLTLGRSANPLAQKYQPPGAGHLGSNNEPSMPSAATMDKLEREKDWLTIASAYLVRRKEPGEALRVLDNLPPGPDADSERALAHLVRRSSDLGDFGEALKLAERALSANPKHGPALWNKALAQQEMGLTLLAARTFDAVAQLGEPDWEREARDTAASLRAEAEKVRAVAAEAVKAGRKLQESGELPDDKYIQFPDISYAFYARVRMSASKEELNKLLPLAKKLDQHSNGTAAQDYMDWAASRDFATRAPLVRQYIQLVLRPGSPKQDDATINKLWDSKENDLAVAAKSLRSPALADLDKFDRHCREMRNPWYDVMALVHRARALEKEARSSEAIAAYEQALRKARAASLDYRQIQVSQELIDLLLVQSEWDQAYTVIQSGGEVATRTGAWYDQLSFIKATGQLARFRNDLPLATACFEEARERIKDDPNREEQRFIYEELALLASVDLRADEARAHLDAAIATKLPLSKRGAVALADVARWRPEPEVDRQAMEAFKANWDRAGLNPGERASPTHALGRWMIELNREEGRKLLEEAIAMAARVPANQDAARARTASITSLVMDAGKSRDFKTVWQLLEREAEAPLPARCAVALTTDSERSVVLALGQDGTLEAEYDGGRTISRPSRLDGYIPPRLLGLVERCPEVKVIARAPLLGLPGALPSRIPWAYVLPGKAKLADRAVVPEGPAQHLVVQNPALSERRRKSLPPLIEWLKPGEHPEINIISGVGATPSVVLGEMGSASEIDIVTHNLVNPNSGEAYLVLAQESGGQDRLLASRIRPGSLPRRPLVLLVACGSAIPAPVLWAPHSLPAAFLEGGAKAVLAAAVAIPVADGPIFFSEVRAQIQRGVPPAIALRDVRQKWLARGEVMKWAEDVILFE